jgi:hypothetical protein
MTEAALARHRPDHLWRLITVALPAGGVVRLLIWSARLTKSIGGSDPSQRKPGDRRRK